MKFELLYLPNSNLLAVTNRSNLKFYRTFGSFKALADLKFDKPITCITEIKVYDRLLVAGEFPELYLITISAPFEKEILALDIGPVITAKPIKNGLRIGLITKTAHRLVFKLLESSTQKILNYIEIPGFNPAETNLNLFSFFNDPFAFVFYFVEQDSINRVYQKKGFGIWRFYPNNHEETIEFNTAEDTSIRRISEIKTPPDGIVVIQVQALHKHFLIMKENESMNLAQLYHWRSIADRDISDLLYVDQNFQHFIFIRGSRLVYQALSAPKILAQFGSASSLLQHKVFYKF